MASEVEEFFGALRKYVGRGDAMHGSLRAVAVAPRVGRLSGNAPAMPLRSVRDSTAILI